MMFPPYESLVVLQTLAGAIDINEERNKTYPLFKFTHYLVQDMTSWFGFLW